MLKKIDVADLRLGMHLHSLDAKWIDHPFWRSRFKLENPSDLATLRASAVRACWIDTSKGEDVAAPSAAAVDAETEAVDEPGPAASVDELPAAPTLSSFSEEVRRAVALCQQSKAAVQALFSEARLGQAVDAEHCLPMVDEIARSVYRNPSALVSVARLKTADDYTYMHSVAVCALMVSLGRTLGMDEAQCREAGLAGLLHDLGKAVMPSEILNKPGKLTDEEFAVMRTHPSRGHEMLVEGRGVGELALDVCLHHHERIDGHGYPHGLSGPAFSLVARMGAVCDVYDAITSNRPYKPGWDPGESVSRMARWKCHFDETVFAAFVKSLGIYPTGSLVRLASQRLAVVVEQNASSLTTPIVNAFYSTRSQEPLPLQRVDLSSGTDRIVCREPRGEWPTAEIERVWAGDAFG